MPDCDYTDCNVPPERHEICAAREITRCWGPLEHQHVPRRSQGGTSCPVRVCNGHHGALDQGLRFNGRRIANRLETWARDKDCGMEVEVDYVIYDRDTDEELVRLKGVGT